jgi:DNA-binding MarR family transcriptional regulator
VAARKPAGRRAQLLEELARAGREQSTASILFHSTMAEHFGLSPTDYKALEVLARLGPLTAGQLVEHTGLASASVTALIDRLEQKGFARRARDTKDRRRVIVETVPEGVARIAEAFAASHHTRALDELWAPYTTEQLEVIRNFLVRDTERARAATMRLAAASRRR